MSQVTGRIRVVLADDHAMVREALARILDCQSDIGVAGQASDGNQLLQLIQSKSPDVAVLDYSMPGFDAIELIERCRLLRPQIKLVMLTVHENIHYAVRALENGVHAYVIKSSAVQELVEAILAVHRNGIFVSPKIAGEVLKHMRHPKRHRMGLGSLSPREFEFLKHFGSGLSLQACADQMGIATSSASTYRSRILEKLKLENNAELIRFAIENGLCS